MRAAALISAFYYFVITMGINVSLHFCKGELSCFSFISESSMCCHANDHHNSDEDHTVCPDNCCSTETLNITLDADFTFESVDFPNSEFSPLSEDIHSNLIVDDLAFITDAPTRGSPSSPPLYLLNSSFIFYG